MQHEWSDKYSGVSARGRMSTPARVTVRRIGDVAQSAADSKSVAHELSDTAVLAGIG